MTDASRRPRVVVVGGGIAGLATAWLLDGACDVTLLESKGRLGGHVESVSVELRGAEWRVDMAAQLFGPRVHPTYMRLLEILGLYNPANPDSGEMVTRDMGTTLVVAGETRPRFVSPMFGAGSRRLWPMWAPWNAAGQLAFLAFALEAKRFEPTANWKTTLDDWLRGVPRLTWEGRENVLLPWLSAMTGCSIELARTLSARAAIAVAARGLPEQLMAPYRWSTARRGLEVVVEALTREATTTMIVRGAEVVRLDGERTVHTADGRAFPADQVVFAAPPRALVNVLRASPQGDRVVATLEGFSTFKSRIVVHTDPIYAHPDRRMWSSYNATKTNGSCEGSIWYGAIRDRLSDGSTLDVWKSWATARDVEPKELVHELEYSHPLLTPAFMAAQSGVEALQGKEGLWFAGSWVRDVDLQETALRSAMRVVAGLSPRAQNLKRLSRIAPSRDDRARVFVLS